MNIPPQNVQHYVCSADTNTHMKYFPSWEGEGDGGRETDGGRWRGREGRWTVGREGDGGGRWRETEVDGGGRWRVCPPLVIYKFP